MTVRIDEVEQAFLLDINQSREVSPQLLFEKLEIAGKGGYGAVYKGQHLATGQVVALKIINLDTADDDVAAIQHEVALLQRLMTQGGMEGKEGPVQPGQKGTYGVPNVIKYYGCWLDGPRVWIVMEFAEGGSVRTLSRAQSLTELQICLISREVITALSFLHRNSVIHRDIKAANILITSAPNRVLLCDFGVSALLPSLSSKRMTFVGTPYWMAPEVITKGSSYDYKADIWSFGITILEMANGEPPLSGQEAQRALMLIPKQRAPRLEGPGWSKEMKNFVVACLNEEPADRSPADELATLPWITKQAKTPLHHLNELLVNMEMWKEKGNQRMSLAPGVGAPIDDGDEAFGLESDEWQFNTVRSRAEIPYGLEDAEDLMNLDPSPLVPPSFPSSSSSSMSAPPQSLRRLFQRDGDAPDPFRSFSSNSASSFASAPPNLQTKSSLSNLRLQGLQSGGEDAQTVRLGPAGGSEFASPPKTATYKGVRDSKNLKPINILSTEEYGRARSSSVTSPSTGRSDSDMSGSNISSQQVTPKQQMSMPLLNTSPTSLRSTRGFHQLSMDSGSPKRPGFRRAETHDPSTSPRKDGTVSSSPMYQANTTFAFPSMANAGSPMATPVPLNNQTGTGNTPSPPMLNRNHSAMPGLGMTRSSNLSSSPPKATSGLVARPGMMRQASVAVMERRTEGTTSSGSSGGLSQRGLVGSGGGGLSGRMTPVIGGPGPASAAMIRSRSGSRSELDSGFVSSGTGSKVVPTLAGLASAGSAMDLKDMLKPPPPIVDHGFDLLPPSPMGLSQSINFRHFANVPSPLSSIPPPPAPPSHSTAAATGGAFNASMSSMSGPSSLSTRGHRSRASSTDTTTSGPGLLDMKDRDEGLNLPSTFASQSPSPISGVFPASSPGLGPPIRPLDMGSLRTADLVYDELENTVREMGEWLSVLGVGLDGLLNGPVSAGSGSFLGEAVAVGVGSGNAGD